MSLARSTCLASAAMRLRSIRSASALRSARFVMADGASKNEAQPLRPRYARESPACASTRSGRRPVEDSELFFTRRETALAPRRERAARVGPDGVDAALVVVVQVLAV